MLAKGSAVTFDITKSAKQKKKDENHILIPQSDQFFHICTKTVIILVQI